MKRSTITRIAEGSWENRCPYSGGIDSSYLVKIAVDTLGRDNVIAAVVNSELFSDREFSEAIDLGTEMGARVLGLEMEELSDPHIASNTPNSWYYSKKMLYQTIKKECGGRRRVYRAFRRVDYGRHQ